MTRDRRRFPSLLVALAVLAGACSSSDDDAAAPVADQTSSSTTVDSTTTTAEPEVDPLDASTPGAYGVGRRTVTVVDASRDGRSLPVDIWYPTDATTGEPSTYSFAPGIEYDSDVAFDAPAISADGDFPLVVYSHGSGGLRYVASFFTETLASHGVVVVAPDHPGNTTIDTVAGTSDPSEVIAANRPLDVSLVISAMLDGSADAEVTAAIDPDEIGVTGHSFGGFTALAVGRADDRVDALVAMAPAARGLSDTDLAAIDIPTMVVSGTLDTTTPIDPNTVRTAALVSGPVVRVDLDGATHQSFTDVCDYTVLLRELPDIPPSIIELVDTQADNTCGPDVLDVDRAQDLINQYSISFLLRELTGSAPAAAALSAAAPAEVDLVSSP